MSGVGSTNAMKKGSANNPFLAFSEADMKGYLNSAYTGCIVKYTGDPIARQLSDTNKTVSEYAQNLVFNKETYSNWGCLKITTKSNGTETVQYLRTLFYNHQTQQISWETKTASGWVPFLVICNSQHPTSVLDLLGLKFLWVANKTGTNYNNYPVYWPATLGWQGENVDADGKVTLWGYSEDVSFVYLEDGRDVDYANMPCVLTPYIVGELYKVVYGDNEYYYEEFYYISEDKTTAGVEDVAPGKTFYDFAGTKQTGTGTRANPFLARSDSAMNAFNSATYLGKFVKYIGKTNNTYVKDAIYQVTNDATEYDRYMILPALENEGTADDLAYGKQLINSKGEIIIGTKIGTLEETDWQIIRKTILSGNAANYWQAGDTKTLTSKSGKTYTIRLCDLQDGRYDYSDGSGKSKAVFEFVELYKLGNVEAWPMMSGNLNTGGWANSSIRKSIIPSILSDLPDDFVSAISEVNVLSGIGNYTSSDASSSSNKLFLPAEVELYGQSGYSIGIAESPLGEFSYYKQSASGNRRIKFAVDSTTAAYWWTRSPKSSSNDSFVAVTRTGLQGSGYANSEYGISLIFAM